MSEFDFDPFYQALNRAGLGNWQAQLSAEIERALTKRDGNLPAWLAALAALPEISCDYCSLDKPEVTAGTVLPADAKPVSQLKETLMQLSPWRKGPFNLHGIKIDSEWRSDLKWARVAPHIADLKGRRVLDVGCGNGYYLLRMAGAGASIAVGIDPSLLFLAQFTAINHYCRQNTAFMLPIGFEQMPEEMQCFDTVFSMGVFYHRRSPFDFLKSLRLLLRKNGELILETLVIEGDQNSVLVPPDRYARMNNVWFIPSVQAMLAWLNKAGFANAKAVDVCKTTVEEQRRTEWMPGESFAACLDPVCSDLTIEGHPAPVRAVFIAERP
ncbi:MAG: tRNA 5-methoxyuridine(34)/uridine 5-oxyacetic acid(34) synthase CmoB [Candidatus Riflebacteria bacterium HGW-Riflebacteria-1]|jgi:tRNA (mo5U34)-methyltransferase|nr:MAG: tRNA 5-methoxyuridine(34)/uridine 5-oxyacetic acid(34) synthase CmoB [Candidatus Riflebacteria bacterium HGW-Riflebacteria-1]